MRLKYIFLFVALVCGASAFAQRISFKKSTINVGTTLWRKPLTATFNFTNKGKLPLVIKNVDAGCGCMEPKWTQGNIGRGEDGEITITYDAAMLGTFDKIIDVYTNVSDEPVQIRMKGRVSNGEREAFEELYPFRIGDVCLATNDIVFPDVKRGDSTSVSLEILNDGQEVYTPQVMHLPPYITAVAKPAMLARGKRGVIEFTLHGDRLVNMGLNQTSVYLARFFGDKVCPENEISVSAILLPDVPETINTAFAPKFEISTTNLNLGKLGKKSKLSGKISITNKGAGVLKLNTIQVFNQALSVSVSKRELAPGESVDMKIVVQSKYLGLSKSSPRVLIITNDPNHLKETVTVSFDK